MRPLRFLLVLALLCPLLGRAQTPAGAEAPPSEGALPPPPLVTADDGAPTASKPAPYEPSARLIPTEPESSGRMVGRLGLEMVGGALGGALGGITSLYSGAIVVLLSCGLEDCRKGEVIAITIATLGTAAGASLGVLGGGMLLDGRGRFLPTFVGALVGQGMAMTLTLLSGTDPGDVLLGYLVAPLVGAIIGYEMSHAFASPEPASRRLLTRSGVRLQPLLSAAPGGGTVGLMGSF